MLHIFFTFSLSSSEVRAVIIGDVGLFPPGLGVPGGGKPLAKKPGTAGGGGRGDLLLPSRRCWCWLQNRIGECGGDDVDDDAGCNVGEEKKERFNFLFLLPGLPEEDSVGEEAQQDEDPGSPFPSLLTADAASAGHDDAAADADADSGAPC